VNASDSLIEYARAKWGDAAAEFVRRTGTGVPVPGSGSYPYQGSNSWRDAGRISPPDSDPDDPWSECWTIVAWNGRQWSAVTIPTELCDSLGLIAS
jgi:hypothetical protein